MPSRPATGRLPRTSVGASSPESSRPEHSSRTRTSSSKTTERPETRSGRPYGG